MKARIFAAALIFLLSLPVVQGATNGYLSFEYYSDLQDGESRTDSFQNVQIGLVFTGTLSPGIDYSAELRFKNNRVEPDQAWLRFFSADKFRLKMGLYRVPFGKYNENSRPHETLLIRPPLNIESTYPGPWRDIGAVAEGRIGGLTYSAYMGNGLSEAVSLNEAQQFRDNNKNKSIGGRLGWFLSQNFEVAYSYFRGKGDPENIRTTILQAVDVTWSTEGFLMLAEYTRGDWDNPEGYAKGSIEGYFIQTSIVLQKIRPVVCFQKLRYSDLFHGQGFLLPDIPGEGIDVDLTRWAFGLVYLPLPNVLLKLEYDSDRNRLADQKEKTILFQAALSF